MVLIRFCITFCDQNQDDFTHDHGHYFAKDNICPNSSLLFTCKGSLVWKFRPLIIRTKSSFGPRLSQLAETQSAFQKSLYCLDTKLYLANWTWSKSKEYLQKKGRRETNGDGLWLPTSRSDAGKNSKALKSMSNWLFECNEDLSFRAMIKDRNLTSSRGLV